MEEKEEERIKAETLKSIKMGEDSRFAHYEKNGMNPVFVASDPDDERHGKPYVILSRDEGTIACRWNVRLEDSEEVFKAYPENIIPSEIRRVWGDSASTLGVEIHAEPFTYGEHHHASAFTELDGLLMEEEQVLTKQLEELKRIRVNMHKKGHAVNVKAVQEFLKRKLPHQAGEDMAFIYQHTLNRAAKEAERPAAGKTEPPPLYLQEFPDYDDTLKMIPGFKDTSWHNDACPSISKLYEFSKVKSGVPTDYIEVFQDYKDPERSEFGGQGTAYQRYSVFRHSEYANSANNIDRLELTTNSWEKAKSTAIKLCKELEAKNSKAQGR